MELIVSIRFISPDNGGRTGPVYNGYRPSITTYNAPYSDCVFILPESAELVMGNQYSNVRINVGNTKYFDLYKQYGTVYIYEGRRLVAEGKIQKIIL